MKTMIEIYLRYSLRYKVNYGLTQSTVVTL